MQPERVRIALVGSGGWGNYHLRQWAGVDTAEIVGIYDRNPVAARETARRHGVARSYESLAEAVGDPGVDAVDVCTPNMLHKEVVVAALQAGKHCLCEKPLAAVPDDIEAMIAARDASGKILMTAQHMRFEPTSRALKRAIAAGRLGEVYYTRAWWLRRRMVPTTPGFLSKKQAGYGPGMDIGVHVLDLAMHLLDHPEPISVSGFTARHLGPRPDEVVNDWGPYDPRQFEVEDFAMGLVRFADGTVLSLEVSWLLNMVERELYGVWLHGTEGGVKWPDLQIGHVQDDVLVDSQLHCERNGEGCKNEMRAFVSAIVNGEPSPVPPEQSLRVARILDALYESAEAGREVRLVS